MIGSFGVGGGERVALDLAAGQRARGADVVVVSLEEPADGPMAAEYAAHGIPIVRLAKRAGGIDVALVGKLAWALRQRGIDIVHTHNPPPLIYGAPAARLAGARCVHTKHGANAMRGRRRLLARAAALCCDAFVAVSATTAEQARANGEVAPAKLSTIENGIDLSRFAPSATMRATVRAELGLPADAFVVGTVGRLVREKNQPLLVRALAPHLSAQLRLVVVGDGPEKPALDAAVAALGERAQWVARLGARGDVPRLLHALDVFALSSDSEGLPLVIVEAMAASLPVVSTAVGGIPAVIVDGTNGSQATGALVPRGDAAALGSRLWQLASAPALGVSWGEEGRRRALARYSAQRMIDDYFAVYERIQRRH
ncbi:MAG TPA: glycosyltransferase [Polyangia bacterium]|nr:glycosyltransferase [Polyangia bacterium]